MQRTTVEQRWRAAQAAVLVATLGFLATVVRWPHPSLELFWNLVVPLLPLSFLLTPVAWRAVCPLATLNMLTNRTGGRVLSSSVSRWAGWPGMLLLAALVPLRHAVFNDSGTGLAALVIVCGVAALIAGWIYEARAGFCNLICPVLPVERLYGQAGVLDLGNPRCTSCSVCTPRGCPDLAQDKAFVQLLGPRRRAGAWLLTASGLFALAFPGFVTGYFTVDASASLPALFGWVLAYAAMSALALGLVIGLLRWPSSVGLPVLGAFAAGLYYWFAARGTAGLFMQEPAALTAVLRVALLSFVGWWLWRALSKGATRAAIA